MYDSTLYREFCLSYLSHASIGSSCDVYLEVYEYCIGFFFFLVSYFGLSIVVWWESSNIAISQQSNSYIEIESVKLYPSNKKFDFCRTDVILNTQIFKSCFFLFFFFFLISQGFVDSRPVWMVASWLFLLAPPKDWCCCTTSWSAFHIVRLQN